MFFDGVEFGRKTRSTIKATNTQNWEHLFDSPMKLILNVAVGGGFTGIGNKAPNTNTWDKPTMEIDYVRTTDDTTLPAVPCLQHDACKDGQCHTCQSRIDYLVNTNHKSETDAKNQVAQEFPDDCDCDSKESLGTFTQSKVGAPHADYKEEAVGWGGFFGWLVDSTWGTVISTTEKIFD